MLNTIRKFTAIALLVVLGFAASPVIEAGGKPDAASIRACDRLAEDAYRKSVREAQIERQKAEQAAEDAYQQALHAAKGDKAKQAAAKRAKQVAMRSPNREYQEAVRAAKLAENEAKHACRMPKSPETTNNNSSNNNSNNPADSSARSCAAGNSTEGTLGHGPRVRNPTVRMDLRVVDETGKPVQGVKTKLWSERHSNGLLCETFHTTDACGTVLMNPIHLTKTLQLKLEAKGFEPQMIQVEPSQLDKPFRAVMQAKKS